MNGDDDVCASAKSGNQRKLRTARYSASLTEASIVLIAAPFLLWC